MHLFLSLAQDAQIDAGLRHSVVRTLSFREKEWVIRKNSSGWYSTKVIGNRLGKASAFELHYKIRFRKTNQITTAIFKSLNLRGHAAFNNTVPFSMKFCFRSSSELQGEVDPTWQMAAFEKNICQNNKRFSSFFCQKHWDLRETYLK